MMRLLRPLTSLFALALAAGASSLHAQTFPDKPLKLVVPFAAGATNDAVGRLIATKLSARLGQTVVVENRTGGGGLIGADSVAKSRPDGHTLLLANVSTMVIGPMTYSQVPYVAERDFVQVAAMASAPIVLVVNAANVPARDINQLVSHVRENPGRLNFASAGAGTIMHLMGESLKLKNDLRVTHVPYRGGAPAVADLLAGNVQFLFDNLVSVKAHVERGTLRALAVTSSRRMASLPSVPTVAELGAPYLEGTSWFTIAAPAQTPAPVLARLRDDLAAIVREDDFREKLMPFGTEPLLMRPEQLSRLVADETAKWSEIVKRTGIRIE